MFYIWGERDFIEISAREIHKGDKISYGYEGGGNYGEVFVEAVTNSREDLVLLQYSLPVGARAESSPSNKIIVSWLGNIPLIKIIQEIPSNQCVLLRRK
jgi:hypothetical protein